MALTTKLAQISKVTISSLSRNLSSSAVVLERFGAANGESGWKWEKNGVGMGGKDHGPATEIKEGLGKDKEYPIPEYFGYNEMSFYDIEKSVEKQRCPQPESGLSEYW